MSIIVKAQAVIPKKKEKTARNVDQREEYHWLALEGGFVVLFPKGDFARLNPVEDDCWRFESKFGLIETTGQRKTLEEAFKAIDNVIYRHNHDYWVMCRCRAVLEKFEGFNNLDENTQESTIPRTHIHTDGGGEIPS